MTDRNWILERVEQAERETPLCEMCGAPTVIVAHQDGALWLECPSLGQPKRALRRWLTLDFASGHTRRLIVDATSQQAA